MSLLERNYYSSAILYLGDEFELQPPLAGTEDISQFVVLGCTVISTHGAGTDSVQHYLYTAGSHKIQIHVLKVVVTVLLVAVIYCSSGSSNHVIIVEPVVES